MRKLCLAFSCFGMLLGFKFILIKGYSFCIRKVFEITGRKNQTLARVLKKTVTQTDDMVQEYIFRKYRDVFLKYNKQSDSGETPTKKVIWTAWLQGEKDIPYAIELCLKSMERQREEYDLQVITLDNVEKFIDIDTNIIDKLKKNEISYAHFTDYIRVKLLSKYGGVWLDATQYMIRPIPEEVWDYDLLVWNKVIDTTEFNLYASIPFVEEFNNGFLIAKKQGLFYKFATEITENLLFDPILQLDYFSNFKAYIKGVKEISVLKSEWNRMKPINVYGLITRQRWNEPISDSVKNYIGKDNNIAFVMTYKKKWVKQIRNVRTVQEYIVENY